MHFPIYVTLDPQGPFDMGREYLAVQEQEQVSQAQQMSEEERQMEQAIRLSQLSHVSEQNMRQYNEVSQNQNYGGSDQMPYYNNSVPGLPMN